MSIFDDIDAALTRLVGSPTALNSAGTNLDVTGRMVGGVGTFLSGIQADKAASFQADQLRQNAGQAQASAQRAAINEDDRTARVMSAALASAAASGGGASDPTVVNIIAKTAAEGAYQRSVALYQGDERAQFENLQADTRNYEGKNARLNSAVAGAGQFVGAGTSFLQGQARGASLYQRFGAGGPKLKSDAWATNGPGE